MINLDKNKALGAQNAVDLAICLLPPAKADALPDLPHVWTGWTETRRRQHLVGVWLLNWEWHQCPLSHHRGSFSRPEHFDIALVKKVEPSEEIKETGHEGG